MPTKRESWLDVAKFVAIYLVVVHHVRDYAGDSAAYAGMAWLENLSSVFNVAVFFAVSGYLSRNLMQRCDIAKLLKRLVVYLWPFLSVVTVVGLLVGLVLSGTVRLPGGGWIRSLLSVGWFFGCLAVCESATFFAHAVARGRSGVLSAGLAAVYVVIWILPVGLCHALEMIPFYWFGMFVLPCLLAFRPWAAVGVIALAAHVVACVGFGDFSTCGLAYHYTTMHLLDFSLTGFGLLLARYAIGLAGACGGLLCIRLLERVLPSVGGAAFLGTETLGVFFFHMQILNVYFATAGWTGGGLAGRLGLALGVFVAAHGLVVLTHRIRGLNAFLWNPLLLLGRR